MTVNCFSWKLGVSGLSHFWWIQLVLWWWLNATLAENSTHHLRRLRQLLRLFKWKRKLWKYSCVPQRNENNSIRFNEAHLTTSLPFSWEIIKEGISSFLPHSLQRWLHDDPSKCNLIKRRFSVWVTQSKERKWHSNRRTLTRLQGAIIRKLRSTRKDQIDLNKSECYFCRNSTSQHVQTSKFTTSTLIFAFSKSFMFSSNIQKFTLIHLYCDKVSC